MPRGSNFQKPYPPEFRREAVALYRSSGRSPREIAQDLGVSSESLRIWVKQSAIDAGERELSMEERAELRELRRCAARLCNSHGRRKLAPWVAAKPVAHSRFTASRKDQ
jgi:transposase